MRTPAKNQTLEGMRDFMSRLARDRAGNTFALITAATVPMIALVGGGVDMGRAYLSQSRLQQACDAGVLAARKRFSPTNVTEGTIPGDAAETGQRFFNLNYRNGAYGSEARTFAMSLENNYAITGVASVEVPNTVMQLFNAEDFHIEVECQAQTSMSNTDIMFVLDVTGSMQHTNPGDAQSRMESMKQVIRDFHTDMEGNKANGVRVRYGFVPYSSNVNVGPLLKSDWVTDSWTYQSRQAKGTGETYGY